MVLVEQNTIYTAKIRIGRIHSDVGQTGATGERSLPDAGDAARNHDARQAATVSECLLPDAGDAAANQDIGQAPTVGERIRLDAGDVPGNRDAGQTGAIPKRTHSNTGDAAGDGVSTSEASWIFNERGLVLVEESSIHIGKIRIGRNYRDCGQAGAACESIRSDAGDAAGNRDAGQVVAVVEGLRSDAGDVDADRDAGQVGAELERLRSDAGDIGANRNARHACGMVESLKPNAGDRQAIGRVGDDHYTSGTSIIADVKGAIDIRREIELRMHSGG